MRYQGFRRRARWAAPAAAALVATALAASSATAQRNESFIKIGSITILSGPAQVIGQETVKGAAFELSLINKHGGVLGKKLQLDSQDDANNPPLAVQAATKLIQQDHVVGIIGPTNSVSGISIQKLQADNKIPAVAYQSGAEALTAARSPWVFRSVGTLNQTFNGLASYLFKTKHYKRFAFLGWNLAAGDSALAGVKVAVANNPGASLVFQQQLPLTTQDFSGAISQAKGSNPDAVLIGAPMPFAGVLAKQIRQSGWNVPIGASGDFVTTDFGAFLGAAANGLVMSDNANWKVAVDRKPGKEFVDAWTKKYGSPPNPNEIVGANSLRIMAEGIRKAGSTDGQKIADAIHKLNYDGLFYNGEWDAAGNLKHVPTPIEVWSHNGTQLDLLLKDAFPIVRKKK
jgi:branched-chain amino acid transport system substrate-binding protein